MPTQAVPAKPRVLIVDESAECRSVLRDLLERQGASVIEARDSADAARAARESAPEAVVFDADGAGANRPDGGDGIEQWASLTETPVVVVGTKRRVADFPAAREFVRKPFHYPALLHKIQGVLATRRAA